MKKSLRSSKTLSRSIITPFKTIQNRQDTTLSENMYSSLCDDVVRRLQVEVDMLRRQFLVDRQQRTSDMVGMHIKVAELSKENIQRFDSLRGIFTQIESNIDERLIQRETKIQEIENSKMAVQSNIDFLFKKTWELDTSISEILNRQDQIESNFNSNQTQTNFSDIRNQLDCIKQYLDKSQEGSIKNLNQNLSLRLEGIQQQVKQVIYRCETLFKSQQWIDKLQDESASINRILKQHQDQIRSLTFREQGKLEQVYGYIDEQWEKKIEGKLSKIINSYNINFQELEQTNLQIKDILQQVINVNGNLSQKLLTVIGTKLDISVFKEAICSLSNQFTQTLTLNYQKINQIRDKQYEVEHELRSLKEILDKHDLDRNGARSVQKDIDQILSHRQKDQPFIVSPRHTARKKLRTALSYRTKSTLEQRQVEDD